MVKNRVNRLLVSGFVIILVLLLGSFLFVVASGNKVTGLAVAASESSTDWSYVVYAGIFAVVAFIFMWWATKRARAKALITGQKILTFKDIYVGIQENLKKSKQTTSTPKKKSNLTIASKTDQTASPTSKKNSEQTSHMFGQVRGAMLEIGFWRFVWRHGCVLYGYAIAVLLTLGSFIKGDLTLIFLWVGATLGGLFYGFLFGLVSWFVNWVIIRLFYHNEKPPNSGKYYTQLLENTSTPKLKKYSLYFVIFMIVMTVVTLFVAPDTADTSTDLPLSASANYVNYTTEDPQSVIEAPPEPPKEYTVKINVISPQNNYDCTHDNGSPLDASDLDKMSGETVRACNNWNYCDVMIPSDIVVRKSATEAIAEHLGRPYSTVQLVDLYAWAKTNIDYQSVPLNNVKPYRPSETIFLKTADCKNYASVLSSMALAIGGYARIVTAIDCEHAWAEDLIGEPNDLPAGKRALDAFAQAIKDKYQQDIVINIIRDEKGYWVILDGSGAQYPGTNNIPGCLDSQINRYYSYSCVDQDGNVNKQAYKKEQVGRAQEIYCPRCRSMNDCEDECKYRCIKAEWDDYNTWDGRAESGEGGLQQVGADEGGKPEPVG